MCLASIDVEIKLLTLAHVGWRDIKKLRSSVTAVCVDTVTKTRALNIPAIFVVLDNNGKFKSVLAGFRINVATWQELSIEVGVIVLTHQLGNRWGHVAQSSSKVIRVHLIIT